MVSCVHDQLHTNLTNSISSTVPVRLSQARRQIRIDISPPLNSNFQSAIIPEAKKRACQHPAKNTVSPHLLHPHSGGQDC